MRKKKKIYARRGPIRRNVYGKRISLNGNERLPGPNPAHLARENVASQDKGRETPAAGAKPYAAGSESENKENPILLRQKCCDSESPINKKKKGKEAAPRRPAERCCLTCRGGAANTGGSEAGTTRKEGTSTSAEVRTRTLLFRGKQPGGQPPRGRSTWAHGPMDEV